MKRVNAITILMFGLILAGCSQTTAIPVGPEDGTKKGVRVFAPKPILIVSDKSYDIAYIPNYNKEYRIRFRAFMAKNSTNLAIQDGMLTGMEADLYRDTLIKFGSTALTKVDQSKTRNETTPKDIKREVGENLAVYDFVFDPYGNLTGLRYLADVSSAMSRTRQ